MKLTQCHSLINYLNFNWFLVRRNGRFTQMQFATNEPLRADN